MIRVVVVDDHAVVRSGLEHLLAATDDLQLVGSAADGADAAEVVAATRPDVVVMDLSMPRVGGIEATGRVRQAHPDCRVLVLTSFGDRDSVLDSFTAGADGYMLKHAEPDEILAAVRAVHRGGAPLDPVAGRVLLESRRVSPVTVSLTERETEVLVAVREGLSNKQIARHLGISEKTVKSHLSRIFQRLDVSDRTQAAVWASRHLPDA